MKTRVLMASGPLWSMAAAALGVCSYLLLARGQACTCCAFHPDLQTSAPSCFISTWPLFRSSGSYLNCVMDKTILSAPLGDLETVKTHCVPALVSLGRHSLLFCYFCFETGFQ